MPLPERPALVGNYSDVGIAVSSTGSLVHVPFVPRARSLVVVQRDGSRRPLTGERREYREPRISPDGRRVAVEINDGILDRDVWIFDRDRNTWSRVTSNRFSRYAVWSADSRTLTYSMLENGVWKLASKLIDDAAAEAQSVLPLTETELVALSWLNDGRTLLYSPAFNNHYVGMIVRRGEPPQVVFPATGSFTRYIQGLSPDGRWLAYVSNQSGQFEAYVTEFPNGVTRQVSQNGGASLIWAKIGSQLYYQRPHEVQPGEIMRVTIDADGQMSAPALALKGDFFRMGPQSERALRSRSPGHSGRPADSDHSGCRSAF